MAVEETVDAVPGAVLEPEAGETLPPPATVAGRRQRRAESATWVIQIAESVTFEPEEEGGEPSSVVLWRDVSTVTVPSNSKRKGVIEKALQDAGIMPPIGAPPLRVRALDENSAREVPVDSEPQLRIGGAT